MSEREAERVSVGDRERTVRELEIARELESSRERERDHSKERVLSQEQFMSDCLGGGVYRKPYYSYVPPPTYQVWPPGNFVLIHGYQTIVSL